jgi:hypothetical protein
MLAYSQKMHTVQGVRDIGIMNSKTFQPTFTLNESLLSTHMNRYVNVTDTSVTNSHRKGTVSAKELSDKWFIGLNSAMRTVEKTTQKGVRDFAHSNGTRRMKHTNRQLICTSI